MLARLLLLAALLLPVGRAAAQTAPLRVVATTTHIAYFAWVVGGDRVQLTSILHPNDDPHAYLPTADDARAIADADVVLRHGLALDRWVEPLLGAAGPRSVYVVTNGIALRPGDENSPDGDPHVWHNPQLAKAMVSNVAAALAERDPADADFFNANAATYNRQLDQLDRDLMAQIQTIPKQNRLMVTNHDAFHYYTDHFGIEFVGSIIPSTSTEEGVPAGSLGALIRLMNQRHVNAVFTENTVSSKVAADIAKQTGAKIVNGLYGDSLGPPGSGAETYEGMMRQNTQIIVEALR